MLDRKDVTDSYVTAFLDNGRILMTSVKVGKTSEGRP
jgi:hypothetical protein